MVGLPSGMKLVYSIKGVAWMILPLMFSACQKEHVGYVPLERDGWLTSSPADQGLDSSLVQEMYDNAVEIDHLYSLLVVKNNHLVAERYFNGKDIHDAKPIASVTKSYTSALTGIAIEEGILTSADQTMAEFFPEFNWQEMDPRKSQITRRQILQMRSGYPWEEFSEYKNQLWSNFGDWLPLIEEFPLESDPGTQYGYSNLMSHILGIIIARAANTSLLDFARTYLCEPLGVRIPVWWADREGYNYGHGDIHSTPRDLARFGQLYLDDGEYENSPIITAEWIAESLQPYSFDIYGREILEYIHHLNLGYMNWFSGMAGNHQVVFSWGHGGQLIFLLHDLDMVIVTTADYLPGEFGDDAWRKEKSVIDLVGEFISGLPME